MSDEKKISDATGNDHDTFCCIHFTGRNGCSVLSVKKCLGEKCSFYETPEEKLASENAWSKRLNTIDAAKQSEIAKKYYGGKKPWKN